MFKINATTRICTLALGISLMSIGINAKVHTWIPLAQAQGLAPQAPVIIIGHISWGSGYFDDSIFDDYWKEPSQSGSLIGPIRALINSVGKALDMADVCNNPLISQAARETTSSGAPEQRFLTANETFNSIAIIKHLPQLFMGQGSIRIMIDSKPYQGFKITYADGASEVWLVNPGWATSSIKVLDTPVPGTLKAASSPSAGCKK